MFARSWSRGDRVVDFRNAFRHSASVSRLSASSLADKNIDIIDICTPPALHAEMILACMRAGKHVICEKPFTELLFRPPGRPGVPIGRQRSEIRVMYERVLEEMEVTRRCDSRQRPKGLFMYAEDWVYAPAVAKTAEILKATKDKILFMKAEESHQLAPMRPTPPNGR